MRNHLASGAGKTTFRKLPIYAYNMPPKPRAKPQPKNKVRKTRYRDLDFDEKIRRLNAGVTVADGITHALGNLIPRSGAQAQARPAPTSGTSMVAVPYTGVPGTQVSAPAAQGYVFENKPTAARICRIKHRELIGLLETTGTGEFEIVYNQPLNPGNPSAFPWLSGISCNWEQFRFKKLAFYYEPSVGTNSDGSVYTVLDYNVQDDEPDDAIELMTYEGAKKSPVWLMMDYPVEVKLLNQSKAYYTIKGVNNLPPQSDPKSYYPGRIYVATAGTETGTVGELYVDYEVELIAPEFQLQQLQATMGAGNPDDWDFTLLPIQGGTPNNIGMLITNQEQQAAAVAAAAYLTFSTPGTYLLNFYGVTQVPNADLVIAGDNGGVVTDLSDGSTNPTLSANDATLPGAVGFLKIEIPKAGAGFHFLASAVAEAWIFAGTMTSWDFSLSPSAVFDGPSISSLSSIFAGRSAVRTYKARKSIRDKNLKLAKEKGLQPLVIEKPKAKLSPMEGKPIKPAAIGVRNSNTCVGRK